MDVIDATDRAKVESEGWGVHLQAHRDAEGQRASGAYFPPGLDSDGPEARPEAGQPAGAE
ncbi:MAG: hypothetical protein QNJ81_11815 [Acidimicrobiia bacterium]|nr:hypothetical protein [Acidimicrobiia bacterium]